MAIVRTPELDEKLRKIKVVIFDNDAVLTDGRIVLGDYGDELKFFDVQDGFGLVLLERAGLETILVSGKKSRINKRRAKDLKLSEIFQNAFDKLAVFEKILKRYKVKPEEVCYVGDDLIDRPPMIRCGVAFTVPNAVPEILEIAHGVTERPGGRGAAREVADVLLKSQGLWDQVTQKYFR